MPGPADAAKTAPAPRRRSDAALAAVAAANNNKQSNGKLDIGKQTGKFDTANVRHRVRQWQAEGGGVVDKVAGDFQDEAKDDSKSKPNPKPEKEHVKKTAVDKDGKKTPDKDNRSPTKSPRPSSRREVDGAWVRPKSKPPKELDEELKFVGTPKKRVVSDAHWRKDRNTPKEKVEPKPYTIKKTVVYTQNDPKQWMTGNEDGIRVRPMRPKSRDRSSPDPFKDRARRSHNSSRPTSSKGASDKHHSGPERDSDHSAGRSPRSAEKRRSRRQTSSLDHGIDADQATSVAPDDSISRQNGKAPKVHRSPREQVVDKNTWPRNGPETPPAPPKVHGNRIEAWLTTTPDGASIDGDDASEAPSRDDSLLTDLPPAPPKHSPSVNQKRQFPSTGHRLSTIASVETLETRTQSPSPSELSEQPTIVPDAEKRGASASGLRRRLTKHEDLMSVLSMPRVETKTTLSARTSSRIRREKITAKDLWDELAADESKYQRELRTVVDGVIPVLLSCVLSKTESSVAAGLFGRGAPGEAPAVTKPIVDMGIALERLKAHHKRIPAKEETALFIWAQGASRIYTDYLKAWRMGFQDVVVNLTPANGTNRPGWDDGLLKNEDGDLVNTDGERVDVAFLLKRPLVRLKYLAKTFKGFNQIQPSIPASAMADKYQQLVIEARKRSNEERARLEDEAAASIDPKPARDPRSLAPLAGVSIDATRCVHARDYFDMELRHSSGQQLDCKIEMILRDDSPGRGNSGDVLICEVSDTGRWLLFPPMRLDFISARSGKGVGELVVMIRGLQSDGSEWRELLSLRANEDDAAPEWIQMLGLEPIPPSLKRGPSILTTSAQPTSSSSSPSKRPTSPDEAEVPIGEVPGSASRTWEEDTASSYVPSDLNGDDTPSRTLGTVHRKPVPPSKSGADKLSPLRELFTSIDSALSDSVTSSEISRGPGLRRSKAKKYRNSPISPPGSPPLSEASRSSYVDRPEPLKTSRPTHSRSQSELTYMSGDTTSTDSSRKKSYTVWLPQSTVYSDDSEDDEYAKDIPHTPKRRPTQRRTSSVPSMVLPSIPKLRTPSQTIMQEPVKQREDTEAPSSAPGKLQKRRQSVTIELPAKSSPDSPTPQKQKSRFSIPSFTPAFLRRNRRSSSPLKHQFDPSTITDSSSGSVYSDDDDSDDSITSESSDESTHLDEIKSPIIESINTFEAPTRPASEPSLATNTLSPSQSASQAPYRSVPQQSFGASKMVASIFSWSDRGAWENLHPQECSIIVTPGLIEAFEMGNTPPTSSDGSDSGRPSSKGFQPLVAFEVTPLVPLRRGTALDISIRSPPTANSLIRSSNNVMFRSRSPEECEQLYSLINLARINNPTYIALQNARGPFNENTWAAAMDTRNSNRTVKNSWWNLPSRKNSTYRSKASRKSVITDSSVGTTNTAFSALRKFGANTFFENAKSRITSHDGSLATSESLSSGASTPVVLDPSQGTPLGISNAKIRLHFRESTTKWRDMGSARLTIMLPPRPAPGTPASPRSTGMEKRVLVHGKTHGEVLLDVTLGESCFERVARTGIAVSVWEDNMGPNGEVGHAAAVGGVMSSKAKVYMIQMRSERDCTYTFGLVGKFRY